jgi:hypothetical protein
MTATQLKGILIVFVVSLGLATTLLPTNASGSSDSWYQVSLAKGKTPDGYRWAVGVKGRKDQALKEICTAASIVEPLQSDIEGAEGENAGDCGSLRLAKDSVSSSVSSGAGASRVRVYVVVYRPTIREVTVVFESGDRKVFSPLSPHIPRRIDRGIPTFRYIEITVEDGACIRSMITHDGKGRIVTNDAESHCAHAGEL